MDRRIGAGLVDEVRSGCLRVPRDHALHVVSSATTTVGCWTGTSRLLRPRGEQDQPRGKSAAQEVAVGMAKTIVLIRHTDNDGDELSPEGVAAAVELGAELDGELDLAVSTGAQRATQTLACMLAGGGHRVPGGVVVERGLRSEVEDEWKAAYRDAGGNQMADFRRVAPDLVETDSRTLGAALRRVADRLRDGQRALVIGHSPTNEAAVLGLTGEDVEPLRKGEGVEIMLDGDDVTVTRLATSQ